MPSDPLVPVGPLRRRRVGRAEVAPLLLLLLLALPFVQGASCGLTVRRSYPPPSAAELVSAIASRTGQLRTIRAETRMSHRSSQGKLRATVRFMMARGGRLRFDAMSPFDTPLATLVSDGKKFALVDAQKNRHYHGPAQPCNIARLLQVVLEADDILAILAGSTPLIAHAKASVSWDEREGAELLELVGKEGRQSVRLDGADRTWDLLFSEVFDAKGKTILRIESSDYKRVGGLRIPTRIHVTQPQAGAELEVALKTVEVNLTLPEAAFEPPEAGGMPSQLVECGTRIRE
jgi:outer membrane lipoprotein-sorting protein